jgi:hypothetical protein
MYLPDQTPRNVIQNQIAQGTQGFHAEPANFAQCDYKELQGVIVRGLQVQTFPLNVSRRLVYRRMYYSLNNIVQADVVAGNIIDITLNFMIEQQIISSWNQRITTPSFGFGPWRFRSNSATATVVDDLINFPIANTVNQVPCVKWCAEFDRLDVVAFASVGTFAADPQFTVGIISSSIVS